MKTILPKNRTAGVGIMFKAKRQRKKGKGMCGPVGSADLTYRVATRTVSPHLPVTLSYITAASFTNYKHIWIGARSTPLYLTNRE
jgi:hypothetical protein